MSNLVKRKNDPMVKIEELLVTGNLNQFTNAERVEYVNKVCDTMGLNPLTRPFEFVTFQGRMVMYARKDCTDQLRKIHSVSVKITDKEMIDGVLFVTVEAIDKKGRTDSDLGAISIAGLKGDALANATMKAITKAKRRVTLSICGLGMLDETELETMEYNFRDESLSNIPKEKLKEIDAKIHHEAINKDDKEAIESTIGEIRGMMTVITAGQTVSEKGQAMFDLLEVRSFTDLNKRTLKELKATLSDLVDIHQSKKETIRKPSFILKE